MQFFNPSYKYYEIEPNELSKKAQKIVNAMKKSLHFGNVFFIF